MEILKIPEFPWVGPFESIDWSNWPAWLICAVLGLIIIGGLAWALGKVFDLD